jgi:hypothetical protein
MPFYLFIYAILATAHLKQHCSLDQALFSFLQSLNY